MQSITNPRYRSGIQIDHIETSFMKFFSLKNVTSIGHLFELVIEGPPTDTKNKKWKEIVEIHIFCQRQFWWILKQFEVMVMTHDGGIASVGKSCITHAKYSPNGQYGNCLFLKSYLSIHLIDVWPMGHAIRSKVPFVWYQLIVRLSPIFASNEFILQSIASSTPP